VTELEPRARAVAAWTLLAARAVYAFNWYNIGGVLPLVGTHFAIGTVDRGAILASFLVGAAVFQLPAGYLAMRWGSRKTSIVALGVMGAFALASAASPDWIVLMILRFGVGGGAAFFFAPALGLVTSYYPSGRRGFMIGAYNAAFSGGSAVGLFLSALIGPTFGWSIPLALGGILLLVITVVAVLVLPATPDEVRTDLRQLGPASAPVLRSPGLWGVAVGGAGLWGGFYVAAQYFVNYAHSVHLGWSLALAAAAPTVMIAVEIAGGPIGGWFGERSRDMRRSLVVWGIIAGIVLAAVPWFGLEAALAGFAVLGFSAGVTFALLYLLPTYLPVVTGNVVALGLALVNFVQILVGSAIAFGFALVAASFGYEWAWLFAGAAAVVFLPAFRWADPRGRRAEATSATPGQGSRMAPSPAAGDS
jgi:MFS transporter, ACDE family, multidrug resistance protein